MKLIIPIITVILISSTAAFAEERSTDREKETKAPATLISSGDDLTFSGYGAIFVNSGKIADNTALFVGGRGAVVVNDSFVFGGTGTGMASPTNRNKFPGDDVGSDLDRVVLGYGGLFLGYHFAPKEIFNIAIGSTIGAGGIGFHESDQDEKRTNDSFFVIEPELIAYVNITRFFRIGAGVTYRYVTGVNLDALEDSDLSGFNASVIFSFGWF